MRHVQVMGSDDRMDCGGVYENPINALPRKCDTCGFPDLKHVPQPYFLMRGRTTTPNEMASAENGNILVRDRVLRVIELLAPRQCAFYPTSYKDTTQQTPWFLMVPLNQVVGGIVDANIPRCSACSEPRSAHPGSQWTERVFKPAVNMPVDLEYIHSDSEFEIVKSSTWGSCTSGWEKWISRDAFMSVRMLYLLNKIKAKGINQITCQKLVSPNRDESAWIKEKLAVLQSNGITRATAP